MDSAALHRASRAHRNRNATEGGTKLSTAPPSSATETKRRRNKSGDRSTSDEILFQAGRLFAQQSYGATSIDDVGKAAGVSGPAIYWHFRGKEDLLRRMLTAVSSRLLDGARERVAAATDDTAALQALIDFQVEFALSEPDLIIVHARELVQLPVEDQHAIRMAQRMYVEEWVAVLGRLFPVRPIETVRMAVQAAIGLINTTPYLRPKVPTEAVAMLLRTMAFAALTADLGMDRG